MTLLKQLSLWARNHKWASRFIIVFSFITLSFLGIATGFLLEGLRVTVFSWVLFVAILICIIAWLKYPVRKHSVSITGKKDIYTLQKTCDLLLISATFIMFTYFGNRDVSPFSSSLLSASTVSTISQPGDSSKNYKSMSEFKKMMKDANGKILKWKERKKLMKEQVRQIKKDNSISEGAKVALIILTVLVALGLAILVAALSCSISCSGSEALAVIVGVIGYAAIIFLTVVIIRSIVRNAKKEKAKEKPSGS